MVPGVVAVSYERGTPVLCFKADSGDGWQEKVHTETYLPKVRERMQRFQPPPRSLSLSLSLSEAYLPKVRERMQRFQPR